MAVASEYGLGPHTFPRGWFVVAESSELDQGPRAVRFFGRDLALYRGESGNPVLLIRRGIRRIVSRSTCRIFTLISSA